MDDLGTGTQYSSFHIGEDKSVIKYTLSMGYSSTAEHRTLNPLILVRIQVSQQSPLKTGAFFLMSSIPFVFQKSK